MNTTNKGGSAIGSVPMVMLGVIKVSRTKWNSPRIQSDMFIISTRSSWIRLCLLFLWLGSSVPCPGQVVQSARFEIPIAERENVSYKVISLEEKGIFLYRKAIAHDNQIGIEVIRLD